MNDSNSQGKIITFYSYKGGTGRSMALANVAWILAANQKRVLILDWDLEAPGLHRYFRPFLIDKDLRYSDGLIDFIINYADLAVSPQPSSEQDADWYKLYSDITQYALSINYNFGPFGRIDLIPAGRQNSSYATRVNSFDWKNFYERLGGGLFIEEVKSHMRSEYDYILIDSRTGVSDTAGICTVQIPDTLVVFFTYNNQSINGAHAVTQSSLTARKALDTSSTSNNYNILPIPTRVEQAELSKLEIRQKYARETFNSLLNNISDTESYWSNVEIPYVSYYGYEEILATIVDDPNDPKRILMPHIRLTEYITNGEVKSFKSSLHMEERGRYMQEYAEVPITIDNFKNSNKNELETLVSKNIKLIEELNEKERYISETKYQQKKKQVRYLAFTIPMMILIVVSSYFIFFKQLKTAEESAAQLDTFKTILSKKNQLKQIEQNTKVDSVSLTSVFAANQTNQEKIRADSSNILKNHSTSKSPSPFVKDKRKIYFNKISKYPEIAYAYYGIMYDNEWVERNFDNQAGQTRLPMPGDSVKAVVHVNARVGVIEYNEVSGWQNTKAVGVIKPNETVKVLEVENVAGGAFIWIKFQKK
ncbi:tyrosine-protein kinase family protein [Telluribacter sp.]|jgi:MinD-like ATPase involved in chromosome partitioning or flagellar assembly|uniref:tyrosine-protein kinase family protein n=1 Tax=Telluribacter sp. TaxID=1978767 RepID=UPI002E153FF9|nr:hypothetical protein [Telluribacter sp.]